MSVLTWENSSTTTGVLEFSRGSTGDATRRIDKKIVEKGAAYLVFLPLFKLFQPALDVAFQSIKLGAFDGGTFEEASVLLFR